MTMSIMMRRLVLLLLLWGAAGLAGAAQGPAILVLGDSLSAAYGIPAEKGWVKLLERRLREEGYPHRVVNGSVSGETTAGGLARLPAALAAHDPDIVLIELGGNDGLRGLPLAQLRDNLTRMVKLAKGAGAKAAVFEMLLPANYGPAYIERFRQTFEEVARREGATLVPFFLAAVVEGADGFQEDGIHPTEGVQAKLVEAVWPALRDMLKAPAPAAADAGG
jgi:acyl-CoA thioesterase I